MNCLCIFVRTVNISKYLLFPLFCGKIWLLVTYVEMLLFQFYVQPIICVMLHRFETYDETLFIRHTHKK